MTYCSSRNSSRRWLWAAVIPFGLLFAFFTQPATQTEANVATGYYLPDDFLAGNNDPINLIVYGPGLTAQNVQTALHASGGWLDNSGQWYGKDVAPWLAFLGGPRDCTNGIQWSPIKTVPNTTSTPHRQDAASATSPCPAILPQIPGPDQRNHNRYWGAPWTVTTNGNSIQVPGLNNTVYIAGSKEDNFAYGYCGLEHCLQDYNSSRDEIVSNLISGAATRNWLLVQKGELNVPPHTSNQRGLTNHPSTDGRVSILCLDPNRPSGGFSAFCDPAPNQHSLHPPTVNLLTPGRISALPGDSVTMSVSASMPTTGPDVNTFTYQWRKNGTLLANGGQFSGVNTASLTISNAQTGIDDGTYDVIVTNITGGSANSPSSYLNLSGIPAITQQPGVAGIVPVISGRTATLTVEATGHPNYGQLTYQWYQGAASDTSNPIAGATNPTFRTPALTSNTSYWVRVSNTAGYRDSQSVAATILSQPTISQIDPPSGQPSNMNGRFILSLDYNDLVQGAQYQWYKDGSPLDPNNSNYIGANDSTLEARWLTADDSGRYSLHVITSDGDLVSNEIQITVNGAPIITAQPGPSNLSVRVGETVNLEVAATPVGENSLTYSWQKEGGPLTNGGRISGADTSRLSINNIQPEDAGRYLVRVTGAGGDYVVSQAVTIHIGDGITLTSPNDGVTLARGALANAQFSWSAPTGSRIYKIFWGTTNSGLQETFTVSTGNSFILPGPFAANLENGVRYYWKVTSDNPPLESEVGSFIIADYPTSIVSVETIPDSISPLKNIPALFDGSVADYAIIDYNSAEPVSIIIQYSGPTSLTGFSSNLGGTGGDPTAYTWKVEAANTKTDLAPNSATYQLVLPDTYTSTGANVVFSQPSVATFFKFTATRNDYDRKLHLLELTPVYSSQPGSGGTISGSVWGNSSGNGLDEATVQVCKAGGDCFVSITSSTGRYSIGGLSAGQYTVTAFPPANTTYLQNSTGPFTLSSTDILSGKDLTLTMPTPPPASTTITSRATTASGLPVVYWAEPLTLTTQGCSSGTATYRVLQGSSVVRTGNLTETPAGTGTYSTIISPLQPTHGDVRVEINLSCAVNPIVFDIYIDPSGFVRTVAGIPIAGTTITLYHSDTLAGPYEVVSDGSAIMSAINRKNPDTTDQAGRFGWDVVAGYYKVRASKTGCTSPADASQAYVESAVLTIPSAVTNLDLRLNCPEPPGLSSLSPAYVMSGGPAFTLVVNGANFTNDAVVRWNGVARPTSFISSTQLTAQITAQDIASGGNASITVATSNGTSGAFTLPVAVASCARPSLSQLSEASILGGQGQADPANDLAKLVDVSPPGDSTADNTYWRWTNYPKAVTLQVNLGQPKTISLIKLFSHDVGKASNSYFQYSQDGLNWYDIPDLTNIDASQSTGLKSYQVGKVTPQYPQGGITAQYFRVVVDNTTYLYDLGYFSDLQLCTLSAASQPVLPQPQSQANSAPHRLPIANAYDVRGNNRTVVPALLDGLTSTGWAVSNQPASATLLIELNTAKTISSLRYFVTSSAVALHTRIEYSTDGVNWTVVPGATDLNTSSSYGQKTLVLTTAVNARYIRFTITNPENNWALGGYGEVDLVGF